MSQSVRPRVVIVGGGVAALEAMVALRDLLDASVDVDMVTVGDRFRYRPLSVAEPFGIAQPHAFDLAAIASEQGAQLHRGAIEAVDPDRKRVHVRDGPALPYDAALIATGAHTREWLPGAIHFAGPDDVSRMQALVAELDAGEVESIAFTSPGAPCWTLPVYELALLTAAHIGEHGLSDVRLTVLTPERQPLEAFGPATGLLLRELCANRGIALLTGKRPDAYAHGQLTLPAGERLAADRVVALPELYGEPITGLPHDEAGFIPVDHHCAVEGMPSVYAAGDITNYPIKQGGLACQQADAAVEAIAATFGATLEPRPFEPMLRAQLLTGLIPFYMTAELSSSGAVSDRNRETTVTVDPLWWPPSKIAGRYLTPYLGHIAPGAQPQRRAATTEESMPQQGAGHDYRIDIAVTFAERDATEGDYASALEWLQTIQQVTGGLTPELQDKRADWQRRLNQ